MHSIVLNEVHGNVKNIFTEVMYFNFLYGSF